MCNSLVIYSFAVFLMGATLDIGRYFVSKIEYRQILLYNKKQILRNILTIRAEHGPSTYALENV